MNGIQFEQKFNLTTVHNIDIYFLLYIKLLEVFNIEKQYYCDNLAARLGHNIATLPPYYCIFDPIEQM